MQHTTESFRVKTTQPKLLRVLSSSPSSSCLSHKVCINHCTSPRGSTNGDEMRSISHPRLRESLAQLREATLTDLSAWKVQSQPPLSGLSQHTSRVSLNNHPNQSQPPREPRLLLYYTGRCRGRRVRIWHVVVNKDKGVEDDRVEEGDERATI